MAPDMNNLDMVPRSRWNACEKECADLQQELARVKGLAVTINQDLTNQIKDLKAEVELLKSTNDTLILNRNSMYERLITYRTALEFIANNGHYPGLKYPVYCENGDCGCAYQKARETLAIEKENL